MKTVLKVAGGIVAGVLILVVGLVACIGVAANEVQDESDEHAITLAEFRAAAVGEDTESQLRRRFGPTADDQEFESRIEGIGGATSSCISYNQEGELLTAYQFCFDASGVLESKSRY